MKVSKSLTEFLKHGFNISTTLEGVFPIPKNFEKDTIETHEPKNVPTVSNFKSSCTPGVYYCFTNALYVYPCSQIPNASSKFSSLFSSL